MLVEALPDTLELLIRACMEALRIAGDRARAYAAQQKAVVPDSARGNGAAPAAQAGTPDNAFPAPTISEVELARAVMTDCVYLAQLAPECFHEVIARVARKAEPERYALLFPLHLVGSGVSGGGRRKIAGGEAGGESTLVACGRWSHPTHLFDDCVSAGKLTTAAWYLPLVRDDLAYDAAQR